MHARGSLLGRLHPRPPPSLSAGRCLPSYRLPRASAAALVARPTGGLLASTARHHHSRGALSLALRSAGGAGARRWHSTSSSSSSAGGEDEAKAGAEEEEHERPYFEEIANKATILNEIDHALGVAKPPALEYIYVQPAVAFRFSRNSASSQNPYGHAAIRYSFRSEDGKGYEQYVMNVVGLATHPLINFLSPEDYLYGDPATPGSEQGGAYNRAIMGIRIEEWPDDKIKAMHKLFLEVKRRNEHEKTAAFSLLRFPFLNFLRLFGEKGNCAYWTSKGIVESGLLARPTIWPKYIFIKLFLQVGRVLPPREVNIVQYKSLKRKQPKGWLTPIYYLLGQGEFFDLGTLANAVVKISPADNKAVVQTKAPDHPFWAKMRDATVPGSAPSTPKPLN